MSDILGQLRRVAYVMFKDGWQSKEVAPLAGMEIISLRADITRLQKELDTAREDALEEAAAEVDRVTRELGYMPNCTYTCASIRALKDKEVAG
ncbi:MAG TPA: hypothetical protein VFY63_17150 [Pseudorhizobium sp.]|nr:hypothetical protein [Pseudorhizobium sp.]